MKLLLKGMGVSQGKAKGKARVIRGDEAVVFGEGDILVTRITDPTMVVHMNKAAAIICDIGGMTSHPSIVSRELGIPCVVSTKCVKTGKPATEILQDGQEIHVDGATGEIHIV